MHRILVLFVAAALSTGALAADKPARAAKAAAVVDAGEPTLKSAGVHGQGIRVGVGGVSRLCHANFP